jgi:predicted alpha-1,2-mannosidase
MRSIVPAIITGMALLLYSCSPGGRYDHARHVDPLIGTGGHGHTFPAATVPFGMIQLGPDTRLTGWDGCSGYHYSDDVVYGFSHTHLSGTGCSDYGDILVTATTGEALLVQGEGDDTGNGYRSRFSHDAETAEPGYYAVRLDDYGIQAEMTVTARAGMHRYTFPTAERANIIVDLLHRDRVIDSSIRVTGSTRIEGHRRSRAWAKDQRVYFSAEFSEPFVSYGIALDGRHLEGASAAAGEDVKAFFSFNAAEGAQVTMRIGISAVDVDGARRNLEAEIPHWDFGRVRSDARKLWNEALGRIAVEKGTDAQKTTFYTALYHSLLAPNLYIDSDGRYRGRDLEIHTADGFDYYTVFSLWDTYRATHPLFTIIERERTVDFIETMLTQYEQGGMLPVWELSSNETGTMIGYHSIPVIVDAWVKGIRDFDPALALEAMKHSADQDHLGLKYYKRYGFIPAGSEGASVSRTLEYAYDDWCIATFAGSIGEKRDYERFIRRAQGYRHIFDPSTGFMRPRMNGGWLSPFDPAEVNFHYTEANAWQYTFYVPQDVEGLITMMGGREAFAARLDELFTTSSETSGLDQPDVSGLIGQYAHGNEPSQHMAYLYNFAGMPWKTQERVREIMDTMYGTAPDGLCGNEDCGQMSAWYVFSALGFYPVTPGSDIYIIGSPLFERVEIRLDNRKTFRISARGLSEENVYIQSATFRGKPHTRSYIRHDEIMSGGELVLDMGSSIGSGTDTSNGSPWGTAEDDIPPSSIDAQPVIPAPYLDPSPYSFSGSIEVTMGCADPEAEIRYTTDGREPSRRSNEYSMPLKINRPAKIRTVALRKGMEPSPVVDTRFEKIPDDITIELLSEYSSMYTAGGDLALIDRVRGGDNFRTGMWQGYRGTDLVAIVDLGKTRRIRSIAAGFLQETGSWIFLPESVEFAVSKDGKSFETVADLTHAIPLELEGSVTRDFLQAGINRRARYIRIRARSIGECPQWHPGAGHPSWLFADEIMVEY